MSLSRKQFLLTGIFLFSLFFSIQAQNKVLVDQVAAVVGDKYILQSDIENQLMQLRAQQYASATECQVLKDLISQKLLLIQAEKDSITVSVNQIESELERRLRYFVRQIGSEEKLEDYYNKTMPEIRQDLRALLHEQMLTQQMQRQIMEDVEVTPKDVERFYKNVPEDSIPIVNKKVEINQIVKYPTETDKSEMQARQRLLELRKRILNGERFSTLAVLYSDDPGTARKGGELGYRASEELDPAFADAAFSLQEGEVSGIVESAYGFHVIKLIDRQGDQVNVRHILIKPQIGFEQKQKVLNKLDSIAQLIRTDEFTFEQAALKYSDDKQYKLNGGLLVNPMNASNEFELDQLPNEDYNAIKDLKVGEVSEPYESMDEKGKTVFKIVRLKSEIPRHRATLRKDYNILKDAALQNKQQQKIKKWLKDRQEDTYIHIDKSFKDCDTDLTK